jgi:hypothetical protein
MADGDEPHYLLVAHSLAYDGDLDLANNLARQDYSVFYSYTLGPAVDGQIRDFRGNDRLISKHDIGLPLLIAPFYRLAGRWGAIVFQCTVAALVMALIFRWLDAHLDHKPIALFVSFAVGASLPLLGFSSQVYPEMEAALIVVWALWQLDRAQHLKPTAWRLGGYSVLIAFLPWLSIKYTVLSALLASAGVLFLLGRHKGEQLETVLVLVIPAALSAALWIWARLQLYGSLLPMTQYVGEQFAFSQMDQGIPGLLLDQEHGLLPYAPLYVVAPVGLVLMWLSGKRTIVLLVTATFLTYFFLVASWHCWWGGWCFPARFLTTVSPVLALPIGYVCRAVFCSGWVGVPLAPLVAAIAFGGVALGGFGMEDPFYRLLNDRDGAANLFLDIGPRQFDWPGFLPSYAPASTRKYFHAARFSSRVGSRLVDESCYGNWAWSVPAGSQPGYLAKGASQALGAGRYQVCVEIAVGASSGNAALLEAALIDREPERVFVYPIGTTALGAGSETDWRCFDLLLNHRELVEFRLWATGAGDVHLCALSLERLGPWSLRYYSPGGDLDLSSANIAHFFGAGWSEPEHWGRWAVGDFSEVFIHLENNTDMLLTLNVFPYHVGGRTQQLSVSYNEHLLDRFSFTGSEAAKFRAVIPREIISCGLDVLRFEYAHARSPAEEELSGDQRQLAVGFLSIEFSPSP